jgi:hypothetical protein
VLRRRTKHFPGRLILEIARGAQIARRAAGRPSAAGQNKTSPGAFTIGWHCECLIVSPIADPGKDPNVKTRARFCVVFYGPIFCVGSGRIPRNSSGAAGLFTRRFPLLPATTGRRHGGSTVLATAPAKTEFCLSKGIPEPRPVAGFTTEQDHSCRTRHGRAKARSASSR